MGKIVKLKNKKTGERVYPVTATKAVVDADSGERLNDTLQNKVEEAPMDGAQYVRKNGAWAIAEVSMDSNEICRINLKSNQGDADNSSLNGATVNVVNTVTSEVIYDGVWDGNEIQLSIPGATTYKVTVGDVADYKTPDAITIEATAFSSRDLIMTYQTEVVSVTLSSDNGVSVVGQIVTINGVQHTWNGSAITQKVAFGVSYSVSVDSKDGYITPDSLSYIANQVSRHLSVVYYTIPGTLNPSPGIYIQDTLGYYFTKDEWDNKYGRTPNGIAVITLNNSFIVALDVVPTSLIYSSPGVSPNMSTKPTINEASSDFDGYANTQKLIAAYGSEGTIQGYCANYTFPNEKKGYMPAAGQAQLIGMNIDEINDCRNKISGSIISYKGSIYSSTYKTVITVEDINYYHFWGYMLYENGYELSFYNVFQSISNCYPVCDI